MLVDVTLVNTYRKPYADSTLNNMKKSELIEYVRMLEYNYNVAVSFNEQQAKNVEKMLEQKWIPVSERLPDVAVVKKNRFENHTESVRVLCACKQKSGKRMVKEGFCKVYADGTIYWSIPGSVDSVTHWMPLPEPPKECE